MLSFGEYELDCLTAELRRNGSVLKLQPQPAKLLGVLLGRAGEVVTRQELAEQVWGSETYVDFEHGLNSAIRQIRIVLQDPAEHPRYLETVPKRGYRFIAPVGDRPAHSQASPVAEGVFSSRKRIPVYVAASTLVVVLVVIATLSSGRRWFGVAKHERIRSLAVLPLHNLSGDPQQEYFSDGMTDELITDLAKVSGLRVTSHTSVERYKELKRPLPEIGRELGVDAIVEGSIMRSTDRVRITAQLIDAHSDQHVWAESYERDARDVLGLQGEVAQEIASRIGIKLTAGEQTSLAGKREVDPAAHESYLKGSFYFNRLNCGDFETALKYYQEAVAKDPTFAPAYSGISETYFYLADWRCWPQATFAKVEPAALKAVELDPNYGEAHASVAELAFSHYWNWAQAGEEFSKALQLDPNNAGILSSYAIYLISTGRQEAALSEMLKALQRDPVSENTRLTYIYVLYLAHEYDSALAQAKEALDMFPDSLAVYYWVAQCYEKKKMPDAAIAAYLKSMAHLPAEVKSRRIAYQKHGLPGYWHADRQFRQRSNRENDPVAEAMYYAHMGDKNRSLEQLNLAYQQHCDGMQFLNIEPVYDDLRDDPRFKEILSKLRL